MCVHIHAYIFFTIIEISHFYELGSCQKELILCTNSTLDYSLILIIVITVQDTRILVSPLLAAFTRFYTEIKKEDLAEGTK